MLSINTQKQATNKLIHSNTNYYKVIHIITNYYISLQCTCVINIYIQSTHGMYCSFHS